MAEIIIKSGKRGRPSRIDIDATYDLIEDLYLTASPRLKEIRKTTKGMRGEEILGTQTTVPEWVEESLDTLGAAQLGRKIDYLELQQIKSTINSLKELSAKRAKVYERGLAKQFEQAYLKELKEFEESASAFGKKQTKRIKEKLSKMTARQKQEFFTSKQYQAVKDNKKYKHVKNWAEADSGKKLTYNEAWAYLYNKKMEDQGYHALCYKHLKRQR